MIKYLIKRIEGNLQKQFASIFNSSVTQRERMMFARLVQNKMECKYVLMYGMYRTVCIFIYAIVVMPVCCTV